MNRARVQFKEEVFKLRRKKLSLLKISKILGIPKSTISGWLKNELWSKQITKKLVAETSRMAGDRIRLLSKINKKRFENNRRTFRQSAKQEFKKLFENKLFLTSLMIYAGEGDLKIENSIVRIANTDWRMLLTFNRFLKEICAVPEEKIHAAIVLYPDLNEIKCKRFWSQKIGIKPEMFHKTQFIKGKHPSNRLKNGIAYVIVCSRELKEKISVWIDLCYKNL